MSYALSEVDRQLANLLIAGQVSAVRLKPPAVRVEADGWTSDWLPWASIAAGSARHWRVPSVGEQALLINPSGEPANGFALVGFYTDTFDGDGRANVIGWLMPDGAVMEYDHGAGEWLLKGCQSIRVENAGTINVQSGAAIAVKAPSIKFDAASVEVTGNLMIGGGLQQGAGAGGSAEFAGSVQAAGDVKAGNISLQGHHHIEQGNGAPTSAAQG